MFVSNEIDHDKNRIYKIIKRERMFGEYPRGDVGMFNMVVREDVSSGGVW